MLQFDRTIDEVTVKARLRRLKFMSPLFLSVFSVGFVAGCGSQLQEFKTTDEIAKIAAEPAALLSAQALSEDLLPLSTRAQTGIPVAELFKQMPVVPFGDLQPKLTEAMPQSVSLRLFDTPVRNQGNRAWCTSFAALACVENLALQKNRTLDLSEIQHWSHYQTYDMYASVAAATRYSVAPETAWPYYGNPQRDVESKGVARVGTYQALTTQDQVFAALNKKHPVVMGLVTNPSWQPNTTGVLRTGNYYSNGGHAVALVGYQMDTRIAGGGYFIIKNSWGPTWGDRGYGYLPFAYCKDSWCGFLEIQSLSTSAFR